MNRVKKLLRSVPVPRKKEIHSLLNGYTDLYSEEHVRRHAREDGERDIPRSNGNGSSPFEVELNHQAIAVAGRVASRHRVALEILDSLIKAEEQHSDVNYKAEVDAAENIYAVEKEAAENWHGLKDSHKQLASTEKRFDAMRDKYNREPVSYIPLWLFIILAIAIFLGEVPLNALVFQIFGENQIMTWVMALIIGLCVPLSAHFIGIKYREHGEGFSVANFTKGTVATAILVAALYGLSVMRTTYLGEFRETLGLTDTLVQSSFMFFWLNVAVFAAAIFISYLSHDTIPGFEAAQKEYLKARKRVAKEERARVNKLKSAGLARAKRIKAAEHDRRDEQNIITALKGHYDMILKEGQEAELQCKQTLERLIAIYRRENLKARPADDNGEILAYDELPSFPLKLQPMEEKLVN